MNAVTITAQPTEPLADFARPKWDATKKQFTQYIGYRMDQQAKKRKRRPINFGNKDTSAIWRSVAKQNEWNQIVQDWSQISTKLATALKDYDWSKPVWVTPPPNETNTMIVWLNLGLQTSAGLFLKR